MTAERAIALLSDGVRMSATPHSAEELDEACRVACDALRLYTQRMREWATADRTGRLVILPDVACTNADGEEALRRAVWDCNYKNNGVTRFTADAVAEKLCHEAKKSCLSVKTPLGDIVAEVSEDRENPGIWVSIQQPEKDREPTLALVEYTATEADLRGPSLITRVWGDADQEDYTDRVVHVGLEAGGAE